MRKCALLFMVWGLAFNAQAIEYADFKSELLGKLGLTDSERITYQEIQGSAETVSCR